MNKNVLFNSILAIVFIFQSGTIWGQSESVSRVVSISFSEIGNQFENARQGNRDADEIRPVTITIPDASGGEIELSVRSSAMLSDEFKRSLPMIYSYRVTMVEDPTVTGHATVSPYGILVTLFTKEGVLDLRPVDIQAPEQYRVELRPFQREAYSCAFDESINAQLDSEHKRIQYSSGTMSRTFNLAIVTTGQYGQTHGGTVVSASAVVTQMVGALEAIYEKELAVKFNLLTPKIYLDPNTDPFDEGSTDRTGMAKAAVEANWPIAAYDIGHAFHSSGGNGAWGGGVAFYGVCDNFYKAAAWSSLGDLPTQAVSLLAHEVGHQFHMAHTFNGIGGSCTDNIADNNSYEIGSGTTIMSYQGSCGAGQNIVGGGTANHYFHVQSLKQALDRIAATNCYTEANSGNTPPVANASVCGTTHTIPKSTPFKLTGTATDADGDPLTYSWEQYDEDGAGTPTQGLIGAGAAANANAPLYRSYPPSSSPTRYFPNLALVAANDYTSSFEPLSSISRTMHFQFTARDNQSVGGIATDELTIVVSNSGPFSVSTPNGGETYTAGNNVTVTWAVNGTNAFCNNVNIKLSIDDGASYPLTLVAGTPNDGSQSVNIPANTPNTSNARIMIECADNNCVTFFDVSNGGFTVTSACLVNGSQLCPVNYESFDAGDIGLNLNFINLGTETLNSVSFDVVAADPDVNNVGWDASTTACQTSAGTSNHQQYPFVVDAEGDYFIDFGGTFRSVHLFADGFDPNGGCANFLASSKVGAGTFWSGIQNVPTLTECTVYNLIPTDEAFGGNTTVTFFGPGGIIPLFSAPTNTGYTYVAIDQSNGEVAAVSATADFTMLPGGSFHIYGANYYSGTGPNPPIVDPNTWVGQTLPGIYASGNCVLFSSNYKPIDITGSNCQNYASTNVPVNIVDNMTVTSTLNVGASGTISDLNITNLNGTHSYTGDLIFSLTSPQNTTVIFIQNQCGFNDDFSLTLDDEAANPIPCPMTGGVTVQPQNPLSAFDGENPSGTWTLSIQDVATQDNGQLLGWGLEICGSSTPCPNTLPVSGTITSGTYRASHALNASGTIQNGNNVIFNAGNQINLNSVFDVQLGAELEATIDDCSN